MMGGFAMLGRFGRRIFFPDKSSPAPPAEPPVINIQQGGTGNLLPMLAVGGLAVWLLTRK